MKGKVQGGEKQKLPGENREFEKTGNLRLGKAFQREEGERKRGGEPHMGGKKRGKGKEKSNEVP